ncbi:MAG: HAMP domain-containing protein, partial [Chloroflexota bacterium]
QNEQITRDLAQLSLYGPYYADPGSTLDPFSIADLPRQIDDADQIFAFQASTNLVAELQTTLQTNDLDSIGFYMVSPFDMIPQAPPLLTVSVDDTHISISRFDWKSAGVEPMVYRVHSNTFESPRAGYFDISSVYAMPADRFYTDQQFELVADTQRAQHTLPGLVETTPTTNIIYVDNVPVIETLHPLRAPLPHPETWEPTSVTVGMLLIRQSLDALALADMRAQLGLDLGFARGDDMLISTLDSPDPVIFPVAEDIITFGTESYYFSSADISLRPGGLQAVVFSPQHEVQAFIEELQRQIFLIAGGVILIGSIVVYICIQIFITNPLQKLTKGAKEIERGVFASRVPVQTHDELGQLAGAFNTMAKRVEELI